MYRARTTATIRNNITSLYYKTLSFPRDFSNDMKYSERGRHVIMDTHVDVREPPVFLISCPPYFVFCV